jgi:multisubunit Na+/H+ antiporter MnhC subunit
MVAINMIFVGLLFFIGLYCLLSSRNMIKLLIGLEIMAKAAVLSFITAGFHRGETFFCQSLVFTFIVVEVSIVAVAMALVINAYKNTGSLDIRSLAKLKG